MAVVGLNASDTGVILDPVTGVITIGEANTIPPTITLSHSSGTSPLTVVASCDQSTIAGMDEHEVFRLPGWEFDWGDPGSGTFNVTRGGSKNIKKGGCESAHTYEVADGSGTTQFTLTVKVKTAAGVTGNATTTISVQAQTGVGGKYAASDIIYVSDTLNKLIESEWTNPAFDRPALTGATYLDALPAWNAMSGKLVLIHRGSDFEASSFRMAYGTENVVVSDFGDDADARAIIGKMHLGVQSDADSDTGATDGDYAGYGGVWLNNITIERLRANGCQLGLSYSHVGFHNIDSDYSAQTVGTNDLGWNLSRSATSCGLEVNGLSPTNVPISKGLYMSEVTMVGSSDWQTNSDGSNGIFNTSAIQWGCFIGVIGRRASEHNFRIHGCQRFVIEDCDFLGDHTVSSKHQITLRGTGYNDLGDWEGKTYADMGGKPTITGVAKDGTNPLVVTAVAHGFSTGYRATITDMAIGGMVELNGNTYTMTRIDADSFSLDGTDSSAFTDYTTGGLAIRENFLLSNTTITNITGANPPVVTSAAHSLVTGDRTFIDALTGDFASYTYTTYTVTKVDDDNFSLDGEDSTGLTFGSGGRQSPQNERWLPRTKWVLLQRCSLSAGTGGAAATRDVKIGPSAASEWHLLDDYMMRDIILTNTVNSPSGDAVIAGRYISISEMTYQGSGTIDDGSSFHLDAFDIDGLGTPSLDPVYIDVANLPVP